MAPLKLEIQKLVGRRTSERAKAKARARARAALLVGFAGKSNFISGGVAKVAVS